jgi:hypothetical protein
VGRYPTFHDKVDRLLSEEGWVLRGVSLADNMVNRNLPD